MRSPAGLLILIAESYIIGLRLSIALLKPEPDMARQIILARAVILSAVHNGAARHPETMKIGKLRRIRRAIAPVFVAAKNLMGSGGAG
jgi:hypothetical protein